uniref:TPR_REGION domain-containing protein n=1 Tax=Haemonchus contortus TaxID=6289 RepID=A0A7I4XSU5_HAECO
VSGVSQFHAMSSSREKKRSIRCAAREIVKGIPNSQEDRVLDLPSVSTTPAYECFAERISESSAITKFEEDAQVGDILIVKVKRCDIVGAYVKPLCFATRIKRDLEWLDLQLLTPLSALSRRISVGQYLEARISSVNPVKVELLEAPPLSSNELPEYFRIGRELPRHTDLRKYIEDSKMMRNTYLAETLRLPTTSSYTFLKLEGVEMDRAEPASAIRKRQNEMLADEYVVRGVEHMRSGNREAAIVVLNQALEINPHCVEALVARGAAYSTNGHYVLAEADFDQALSLMPTHSNARNYMVETLVKYASLLEVQGDLENAKSKFEKVLRIKEDRRARTALAKLDRKRRSPSVEILENEQDKGKSKSAKRDVEEERKKRRRTLEAERERKRESHDNRKKLREMEEFIKALREKK